MQRNLGREDILLVVSENFITGRLKTKIGTSSVWEAGISEKWMIIILIPHTRVG